MKLQDQSDNFGEQCVDCGHARKFHWVVSPWMSTVSDDYEMSCMWDFEIGKCEQKICGCRKHKKDFCVISGI